MNRHIDICHKDIYYLNKLSMEGLIDSNNQPLSYRDLVVLKPWGYEFLAFENGKVAIWILYIKKRHSTSMHCHPKKQTALMVLSGKAFFHTFLTKSTLKRLDAVSINKGVFHSTTSVSRAGSFVLEFEMPSNKTDLVRFNDSYGRIKTGYESMSHMVLDDLHQFGYFHFIEGRKNNIFSTQNFEASLREYKSNGDFVANFTAQEGEKFLICRGAICWGENHCLGVGEIFDILANQKQPYWIKEPLTLFVIQKR